MVITLYFVLFFSFMIYFEQQRLLMTPTPRQSGIIQAASVDGHQTIEALADGLGHGATDAGIHFIENHCAAIALSR